MGFGLSVPTSAAPVPWLYDVDVAAEGRTAQARRAVSGAALAEVLSRVSGLAHVPRNAEVRAALNAPEAYYNRFVYLEDGALRIHFVPAAILALVDAARLPVWSVNRPQVMVWLVVEDGHSRQIVGGDHAMAKALRERARQRGLVLKLPLMDLEDSMRVQPAVIGGRLFDLLESASERYGAEAILVGHVRKKDCAIAGATACGLGGGTYYAGSLEAWLQGEEVTTGFALATLAEAGRATADFIVNELAARYAVLARERNHLALTISGVDSPASYGRLLGYLEGLEFVSAVDVLGVDTQRLDIRLHTRATLEQLLELFARDGQILPDPTVPALLIWRES